VAMSNFAWFDSMKKGVENTLPQIELPMNILRFIK